MAKRRATKKRDDQRDQSEEIKQQLFVSKTKSRSGDLASDIPKINFDDEGSETPLLLSPKQAMEEIVQGSKQKSRAEDGVMSQLDDGNVIEVCNFNPDQLNIADVGDLIEITTADVKPELDYWNNAVVLYVIGANPRTGLIDGFSRRLWGKLNVDKVILIKSGIYLVRFLNIEAKNKALSMSNLMLDKFPVFLKPWEDGMEFDKHEFVNIPVWLRISELPLKYWGCLQKILQKIGTPIKPDNATAQRDKIRYARYCVEMDIHGNFPDQIVFKNEQGVVVDYPIHYEWKPQKCVSCGKFGHDTTKCTKSKEKNQTKKIWVPKRQDIPQETVPKEQGEVKESRDHQMTKEKQDPQEEKDGFTPAKTRTHSLQCIEVASKQPQISLTNSFRTLDDDHEESDQSMNGIVLTSTPLHGERHRMEC